MTFQHGYSALSVYLEASNIQLEIPEDGSIAFGDSEHGVTLTVTSGTLNGTSSMTYWREKGKINIVTENAAEFTLIAYGERTSLRYSGTLVNEVSSVLIYGSTVSGDSFYFGWETQTAPLLPIMFIIGVIGLFTFVGGLLYLLYKFKEGEYVEGMRKGIIFMSLGFGLVWGWLNL